jgi:hypothetical protein
VAAASLGDALRDGQPKRGWTDLQLDPLHRLLEVGIARRLDMRLQRAQCAVEPEVVLVEHPQAQGQGGEK